ncbi:hypothetical protein P3X46_005969 [Hevea brasiliensis]|uniref:HMA domain-containing protein n=1 Tax=Hevea brasiliensis TaxID=3981 RepID=A0ABQ9MS51_HEVBR|nr:heavy metal-associated isoprenylated plant protein 35 [Hevea brasiliensis]KAJ9181926.1 hypothetical protein P3X46_005969 [Hevea brasiliensis]
MAATTFGEEPYKALKCQTWVLKVSIHCQGCKRKVKKVLQGIDGVYTATVDSQQQRVTVTGNIEVETLIKKLIKTGKHAQIWPEKLSLSEEKESAKAKDMHKQKDANKGHDFNGNGRKKSVKFSEDGMTEKTKDVVKSLENAIEDMELPMVKNTAGENEGGGGGGVAKSEGKKKKKKGQKGDNGNNDAGSGSSSSGAAAGTGCETPGVGMDQLVGPSNLSPTCHESVPFPQGFIIPPVYASSYSMAYPRESPGPFYYVPLYAHPSRYNQMNPLDSFYYFSDENINGCFIM